MSADEITVDSEALASLLARRSVAVTDIAGLTVQGTNRAHNEDAWGFHGSDAFVVADGMGGRPGGAVAAAATVEALLQQLCSESTDWSAMIDDVNRGVGWSAVSQGFTTVGSVAVGMRCRRDRVSLVHVGDARAYRLRKGVVQQLTRDHSIAEAIATLGVRRSDSGLPIRQLAAVTSFFGDEGSADEFSVHELTAYAGDRIVLCSDGVHGWLDASEWMACASKSTAQEAVQSLVDTARSNGSTDDCTALVVDLDIETEHSPDSDNHEATVAG